MRKFHRITNRRRLFLKSIMHNLVMRERMETTVARAKEVRPSVERLVTLAKRQNVASLRRLLAKLPKDSAEKLYYEIAPKYKERNGGYLRIVKEAKVRKRDATPLAIIEFVK